jgi:uncharacterized protein YegP (UPF0339 family)
MRVIVYLDEEGLWRRHAKSGNGKIVSESGEGYEDQHYAINAAKKFGPTNAVIIEGLFHACVTRTIESIHRQFQ